MVLTVFDKTEKMDGFIEFAKEQLIKTWTVKRTGDISTMTLREHVTEYNSSR